MEISSLAGKIAGSANLINVPKLVTTYFSNRPDATTSAQKVIFGTSGHRGSAFKTSFNEWHILAITQSICEHRRQQKITGPLFLGIDTHALSVPAVCSALEVLAANNVHVMIAKNDEYTPTPAISHAILSYNFEKKEGLADGIIITPSHNPPEDGGFKYNPTNGGPADKTTTDWIEAKANEYILRDLKGVLRIPYERALHAPTTHRHDFVGAYVNDLEKVLDMNVIKDSKICLGVDPLGGAGVHYWHRIAEQYHLDLTVVNQVVDPTFRFMTLDWDGKIRMDPSSPYAMRRLIGIKDQFDVAFACDTDHDRHGIVTKKTGLMPSNHYLVVAINYLIQHRLKWNKNAAFGKTIVSSQLIDRIVKKLGRTTYEVPVGFKWFVNGLLDGSLGFGGEESGGASFLRSNGSVWTTDKDGILLALLAGEITARVGKDPGDIYQQLSHECGEAYYKRIEAAASPKQKAQLLNLSAQQVKHTELAGEKIQRIQTTADNGAAIGGLKVVTESGWFAARPSGTESIYKIYAESFSGPEHLEAILKEAQEIVNAAFAMSSDV